MQCFDIEKPKYTMIEKIDENRYLAQGMMRIDELVEYFDLDKSLFEEDDVETIAGLAVKLLGRIAEVGDSVSSEEAL